MIHATDNQIQDYSLNSLSDTAVAEHIRTCLACRSKAEQYISMFKAIHEQEVPSFDFHLTGLVMGQLPVKQSTERYVFSFIAVVAAGLLAVIGYFIRAYVPDLLTGLAPLLISLIVLTGLVISAFLAADMYKKHIQKMNALNF
jgi:hypothetical protein